MLISQYIYQFVKLTPVAPAMIYNGRSISYSEFFGAISATSAEIASCSVQSSGTVAVMTRNLADCWVITLALQSIGYTTISVSSVASLELLQVNNLAALFVSVEDEVPAFEHGLVPIFAVSKPIFQDATSREHEEFAESVNESGHILYTSGTTGSYKMYRLSSRSQQARDLERSNYYRWDKNTRFHGLNFGLWTAIGYNLPPSVWSVGGCVLFDQQTDWPGHFFDHNPSFAFLLPDQASQLCQEMNPATRGTEKGADLILYACGGFLSNRVAQQLLKNVTGNIVITYGSSEINSASFEETYQSMEDVSWITPTGNRVLEIVDEQGQVCAMEEEGYLRVKLKELDIQAYLDSPEATSHAFRNGYFYPGDMAAQREDGKFRILGRVADVINIGGQKRPVAPIEANLQSVLQLDYVCLFSGIDADGETEIVVAMETTRLPDEDRLRHVGREFSQWGKVRFAHFSPFPRTQSGTSKIDRKQLRNIVFPNENV